MTGGWHGESARHALAAKGIPTAATRAARGYHTARPLEDRLADEARMEPYVEEIALWAKDPDKYDLRGVDDPVPDGFHIEQTIMDKQFRVNIYDDDEKDPEIHAGSLTALGKGNFNEVDYFVFILHVDPEYRGMELSRYLLRYAINLADEMGIGLAGIVAPYYDSQLDEDILMKYYGSFGFVATKGQETGSFDIVRPPQPKEGSLNE